MYADLAECFGKERIFALGLLFLAPIFMMILAFGDATYCETVKETVDNPSNDAYSEENTNEYSETTMFSENSQEEEY